MESLSEMIHDLCSRSMTCNFIVYPTATVILQCVGSVYMVLAASEQLRYNRKNQTLKL
jgi:hypothetical protein